jgi:multiple sugar transport system substrate-binding protein
MKKILISLLALAVMSVALAQTTVRIMGYGGEDPRIVTRIINEVIADELAAAGITVRYEPIETDYNVNLLNALSAGTAADVFYIPAETAPGIIASGRVLPLDGLIDPSPFIPSLIETFTFNGQLYGIAKDFNTLAIHYNKDLFDEAGVEYPNENDTWETFAEKLRQVAALDPDVYGACFPADYARFGAFAFAAGWRPFDAEGNTNLLDERFVEAFTWYTDLVRERVAVLPGDIGQGWTGGCFATDNVGIAIEGAWILGFLRDTAPNLQFGSTYMPIGPSGERGNFLYTVAWGVNRDSPNRDAALKVLELLTSEPVQQFVLENGLAIPSRAALIDNPYFALGTAESEANRVVFEGASQGFVYGFQFGEVGTDWMAPINNALTAVMTGQSDVNAALIAAQNEIGALIARARR